jgi:type II secretory pathway component PulF
MSDALKSRLKWIAMNDALLLAMAAMSAWLQLWGGVLIFCGLAAFGTAFVLLRSRRSGIKNV